MSGSFKKQTVKLSFDQKERAVAVLSTLVKSHYFGDHVPDDAALSRMLRIPRSALLLAINHLTAQKLITPSQNGRGWDVSTQTEAHDIGRVAFIVNTDPVSGWYSLFQDWLIGFEAIMSQENYCVEILCGFHSVEEKKQAISTFRDSGGMGCVLASRTEPGIQELVLNLEIPSVILGNSTIHVENLGCICSDNLAGIHNAVKFLISRNHRNISMYVTGLSFHDGFNDRYHAYQQAMRQHHLASHSDLAFPEAHNDLTARRAADVILRMKRRPDAVLCASDREAFELVSELRHLKINVPDDISVMGFDNNHFGSLLEPPMTTVDIHAPNMGQIAAHYLLNEMQAPQLPVKINIPTGIVIRNSVAEHDSGSPLSDTPTPLPGDNDRILSF